MNYWNDPRWKAVHNGSKTVEWFLSGHRHTSIKYSLVRLSVLDWQRRLKRRIEDMYK